MFHIKRTFGINHDWLHGWDDQWGTSCMIPKSGSMQFGSREEADIACARANSTCVGFQGAPMPEGMKFTVWPVN